MEIPLQQRRSSSTRVLQCKRKVAHSPQFTRAACGKRNTTRSLSHSTLSCSFAACLPFRHCHCVSCNAAIVCVHDDCDDDDDGLRARTLVQSRSVPFETFKRSVVSALREQQQQQQQLTHNSTHTHTLTYAEQPNTRRPHNTFACGPLFLFFSFCFV